MRIVWTRQASEQLGAMHTYLARNASLTIAVEQVSLVLDRVEQLSRFPKLGRSGRISGTRELVIEGSPYLVAYRVRQNSLRILALLHGARRWPKYLPLA